jgi:hypothetical protein
MDEPQPPPEGRRTGALAPLRQHVDTLKDLYRQELTEAECEILYNCSEDRLVGQ